MQFPATITKITRAVGQSGQPYVRCVLSTGHHWSAAKGSIQQLATQPLCKEVIETTDKQIYNVMSRILGLKIVILWEQSLIHKDDTVYSSVQPVKGTPR